MTSKKENKPFQFQQFSVDQRDCGMKITEDAVCFGAWVDLSGCRNVLDIGTGTGLLSMMLAQRYGDVKFTAIEIDPLAASRAQQNFDSSPWSDRLEVICGDALHADIFQRRLNDIWRQMGSKNTSVDALVCNPPFFHKGTAAIDEQRKIARDDTNLPFGELWKKAIAIAKPKKVSLLVSTERKLEMDIHAQGQGYALQRCTLLTGVQGNEAHCAMLEYRLGEDHSSENTELFVRNEEGEYQEGYLRLVKGFYLKR